MSDRWNGCRVSIRPNLWYDDDMRHWTLFGKEEHLAATGAAGEMVRLALVILENLPDTDENGPPMGLGEEREALPLPASDLLAAAVDLAQNRTGDMTDEQYSRTGALMAVATHMLGAQSDEAWTSCRTPRFPFSMRLDPDPASPGRRGK